MLSFQTFHTVLVIFIAIWTTDIVDAVKPLGVTAVCKLAYNPNGYNGNGICFERDERIWQCPTKKCSYNGNKYTPMSGCKLVGSPHATAQNVKCAGYEFKKTYYECGNTNGQNFNCPIPKDLPYITCSDCDPA